MYAGIHQGTLTDAVISKGWDYDSHINKCHSFPLHGILLSVSHSRIIPMWYPMKNTGSSIATSKGEPPLAIMLAAFSASSRIPAVI